MGVNYGNTFQLVENNTDYTFGLSEYEKQRFENNRKHREGFTSLFRILIVIAEVGLSLVPGLQGTAAMVGIGLAGATANTALSVADGTATGIGIAFDYATAFIPGITDGLKAAKIKRVINSTETLKLQAKLTKNTYKGIMNPINKQYSKEFRALSKSQEVAQKEYNKAITMAVRRSQNQTALQIFSKGYSERDIKAAVEIAFQANKGIGKSAANKVAERKILEKWFTDVTEGERRVSRLIQEWEEMFNKVKDIPFSKRISNSSFTRELEKISGDSIEKSEILKDIYLPQLRSKYKIRFDVERTQARMKIVNLYKKLSPESRDMLRLMLNRFRNVHRTRKENDQIVKLMMEFIKKNSDKDFEIVSQLFTKDLEKAFHTYSKHADPSALRNWIRRIGSKRFNDKVVQIAQLIDPNDVGRFPIEQAYQYAKNKLTKKIEGNAFDRAVKKLDEALPNKTKPGSKKLRDAWEKSGGELFKKRRNKQGKFTYNRYLLGFKVLSEMGGTNLVLIKFNKIYTKSRSGKNVNGKRDIIITASNYDLKKLREEGVEYWFRVGKKKGWFVSRGGKSVRGSFASLSTELSLFLGFVPIPALRNVLSIVSNWVENIKDISKGEWGKNWWPKFERAFVRSLINRSARLVTKTVIGGRFTASRVNKASDKALKDLSAKGIEKGSRQFTELYNEAITNAADRAKWLGRELQRFSTATLSTFEGKNSKGFFTFHDGASGGRSGIVNLGRKIVFASAPTAARGALVRKGRRIGARTGIKNTGRKLIGTRRNLGQIGRIWSAVTPSGSVKQLRTLTKLG